jgi:C4-dicarboxylate-specific signal transduction histidine kinase
MEERLLALSQAFEAGADLVDLTRLAVTLEYEYLSYYGASQGFFGDDPTTPPEIQGASVFDALDPETLGTLLINTEEMPDILAETNRKLLELKEDQNLQSVTLLTDREVTLASTDPDLVPTFVSAIYELDREEITMTLQTGQAVVLPLYAVDDTYHKRLYFAFDWGVLANDARLAIDPETLEVLPRIVMRLEADADYLRTIGRLQRLGRTLVIIGFIAIVGLSAFVYVLLRRLQLSNDRLRREDRFRLLGKLAAGLAHELRNPLGILRFSVEEIAWMNTEQGKTPAVQNLTEGMFEEIDRMNRLITNILSFSNEGGTDAAGDCELMTVMRSTWRWLVKSAPESWKLKWNADDINEHAVAQMSEDALRQVTLNLLRNAHEAMEKQTDPVPEISLSIIAEKKHWLIIIEDNGPGIPEKVARKIFDPFYTTKDEGTGLGLSISARLLESIKGSLQYIPRDKAGARFELRVPRPS